MSEGDTGKGPLPNGQWWGALGRPWPIDENATKGALLQVMAFTPEGLPQVAGCAAIIAAGTGTVGKGFALALSARHVLDHAQAIQDPNPKHAPSALAEFLPKKLPSIDPLKLRMMWMGANHGSMLKVVHACYADHDVVGYVVQTQDDIETAKFKPSTIPLDLQMPNVGDQICLIAQLGLDKIEPFKEGTSIGFTHERHAEMYMGVVTHVAKDGYRQHKNACFTISIPTLPGMSGSPVYVVPKFGKAVGVCGVVSADFSPNYDDGKVKGESVIACAWVALAMEFPEAMHNGAKMITLYEYMRRKRMPKALGGFGNFSVEKSLDGNYRINCPITHGGKIDY